MQTAAAHPAIVACHPFNARDDRYLRLVANGGVCWEDDPALATAFDSMREAMRAALRLPAAVRAFGLPRPQSPRHTVGAA